MRLLYLTPGCFDKGGISRYSRYQISALREILGNDSVRTASLLGPDSEALEEDFLVDWQGPRGAATGTSRIGFALYAARQALLFRPDVILCAHVNFTPLVKFLARLCNATSVLNVYGLELWSGLSEKRLSAMSDMDHVISDCHSTANHVREHKMHSKFPEVIWDCVDLGKFSLASVPDSIRKKYSIPDKTVNPVVLTLGRLAKAAAHKGYDRLISNFAILLETMPEARLVIAGRGDMRDELEQLVAVKGCTDRVVFTGSVDEQDLPDVYRSASVFSLVSDKGDGRGEGIPLTPLEAMACGVPIIVGDEDGSAEAVLDNRNGIIISPHDSDAHVDAMKLLLSRNEGARAEARAVAEENFSYDSFVEKHRKFLKEIATD